MRQVKNFVLPFLCFVKNETPFFHFQCVRFLFYDEIYKDKCKYHSLDYLTKYLECYDMAMYEKFFKEHSICTILANVKTLTTCDLE